MGHSNSMRSILRSYLELRVYIRFAYLVFLYLLIVLLTVIEVVLNNWDKLGVPFTIVASVAIIGRITYFTIIGVKNSKIKKDYLNSRYYQVHKSKFIKEYLMPFYQFQFKVYDELYDKLSKDVLFDIVPNEQILDRGDESIDLVLFHSSGIYAVQTLNLEGPLKGDVKDRTWAPHFYLGKKKELRVNEAIYNPWKRHNILSNPIMQTDLYVKNLKKYLPNYNLKGVTIVGDLMIETPFNSFEGRLTSLEGFIKKVLESEILYTKEQLLMAKSILMTNSMPKNL